MKKVFLSVLVAAFFSAFVISCGNKTEDDSADIDSTEVQEQLDVEEDLTEAIEATDDSLVGEDVEVVEETVE